MTIQDAQGHEIYREDLPLTDMGTFYGEVQLADEAALRSYDIQAAHSADEEAACGNFRVAEYRKPELNVSVTSASGGCQVMITTTCRQQPGTASATWTNTTDCGARLIEFLTQGLMGSDEMVIGAPPPQLEVEREFIRPLGQTLRATGE